MPYRDGIAEQYVSATAIINKTKRAGYEGLVLPGWLASKKLRQNQAVLDVVEVCVDFLDDIDGE